jgi:hypothetical protein
MHKYATGNPQKSQVYEKRSNSCKMNEGAAISISVHFISG